MIIKTLIALIGMSAIGWIAWRLVNMQEEPAGLDDNPGSKSESRPCRSADDSATRN